MTINVFQKMKFPITRESLQAFDQVKEDAEKKDIYYY